MPRSFFLVIGGKDCCPSGYAVDASGASPEARRPAHEHTVPACCPPPPLSILPAEDGHVEPLASFVPALCFSPRLQTGILPLLPCLAFIRSLSGFLRSAAASRPGKDVV